MKSNLADFGPDMSSKVEYCGFYVIKICVSCPGNQSDHEVTQTAGKHAKMGQFLMDMALIYHINHELQSLIEI